MYSQSSWVNCKDHATLPVTDIIFIAPCQCLLRETKLYVHLHTEMTKNCENNLQKHNNNILLFYIITPPRYLQTRDKNFYSSYLNK